MRKSAIGWLLVALATSSCGDSHDHNLFQSDSDVGSVMPPGSARFDATQDRYTLTAAGANTWYRVDAFHYLWKKASGNLALTADISFPPPNYSHEPNPHRKGILMIRQSLDASSAYVDVAAHGSGLTALQFRRDTAANTEDIELNIHLPKTLRIEKRGDEFTLLISMHGEPLHAVGASVNLHLNAPFYVGLGALSHDAATSDTVEFAHVRLGTPTLAAPLDMMRESTLEYLQIEDQFRRAIVIRSGTALMQSPDWSSDGNGVYVHESGRILKVPFVNETPGEAVAVDVSPLLDCSGNYGISPSGELLAVSCAETKRGEHQVYVLSPQPGAKPPRRVTQGAASYFHAWSPDSKTIAFTRGSASGADIYTVSVDGGPEKRLTSDGLNDGPDYTPDGQWIYYDSARSGRLQIWRMHPDGSGAEQLTGDLNANSSPHVSPDGKSIAFLSQPKDSGTNFAETQLKILTPADGLIRSVTQFNGNRGSLAMNSWADANHLTLVRYQMLPTKLVRTQP